MGRVGGISASKLIDLSIRTGTNAMQGHSSGLSRSVVFL